MTYHEYREQLLQEFEIADENYIKTSVDADLEFDGFINGKTNLEATKKREKALNTLLKFKWHLIQNNISIDKEMPMLIYDPIILN